MTRVRFAPSPTGSLHIGNALSAVATRNFGEWMLLRIDDTDPARNVPGGEQGILDDLRWLGVAWDEGPLRASERAPRHREAAAAAGLRQRFEGVTLWRDDGSPTYHLASVVDDADFGITHVIRGNDHRPNEALHTALHRALGTEPPVYLHHGLILGQDGKKMSKRTRGATVASLRDEGLPAEAVRAYLDELGLPRHDVHLDLARIRSLAVEALAALSDAELAARVGVPVEVVPALRGTHTLVEARQLADVVLNPPGDTVSLEAGERETLERFRELRERADGSVDKEAARAIVRELKAVGGNLRAVRGALTGRDSGPELWAIVAALPRDETLRRIDAAL
jgi:glutamyl/glutaminyl-tRNA synthetase